MGWIVLSMLQNAIKRKLTPQKIQGKISGIPTNLK